MPTGAFLAEIYLFAGNFAPRGFAFCNGQILSISQNTALFSLLGTTYGGNGQTTFALPDLRGRVPVGTGQGPGLTSIVLGEQAGTETVTLISTNLPAHNHTVNAAASATSKNPSGRVPGLTAAGSSYADTPDGVTMNPQMLGLTGGSQPFATRNPYLGLNYVIAIEGIFPARN